MLGFEFMDENQACSFKPNHRLNILLGAVASRTAIFRSDVHWWEIQ